MAVIKLTDENFDDNIKEGVTLVDFWAEWCGPCKMIAPVLEEISEEKPQYKIAKLNVDENAIKPVEFSIRSIPTLYIFKDGQVVDTLVGALPKASIIQKLNQHA